METNSLQIQILVRNPTVVILINTWHFINTLCVDKLWNVFCQYFGAVRFSIAIISLGFRFERYINRLFKFEWLFRIIPEMGLVFFYFNKSCEHAYLCKLMDTWNRLDIDFFTNQVAGFKNVYKFYTHALKLSPVWSVTPALWYGKRSG